LLRFAVRFRKRTPTPPPFSSMNSMPAANDRENLQSGIGRRNGLKRQPHRFTLSDSLNSDAVDAEFKGNKIYRLSAAMTALTWITNDRVRINPAA
jgi:hypothetical protein